MSDPVPESGFECSETGPAGLPASAYTDPEFLAREQAGIFRKGWICIAVTDDVKSPGDAVPLRVANRDLVLLRDHHGEIRVHHNYCRHRGHPLLKEKACGLKRLVCPYHAWAYDLDGTLRKVPHFDGAGAHRTGEKAAELPGLEPVRTALWHRLVFVNLSGDAEPFEEFIAPLAKRWGDYDFSSLRHGKHLVYEAACNWKLAIENFIDFYHLPAVHKGLNGYSAMQDHYVIREDGIYLGEGNDRYAPDDEAAGKLPAFAGLPANLDTRTEALCLFPNLLITVFNDNLRIIIVDPLGSDRCRERIHVFFSGDEALSDELADVRDAAVARFVAFNDEDIEIIEALQAGFAANGFDGGCFSPYFDQNISHFQALIRAGTSATAEP